MTNKEYEYIIEQQKELIKQQKEFYEKVIEQQIELIKSLTVHNKVFLQKDGTDKIEPYYPVPPIITCSEPTIICSDKILKN
ncbi:MAG: hypothetical protein J6W64_07160 [Bacilli bacterium]|nr:hypothetical protein [Bacilli bacterium]